MDAALHLLAYLAHTLRRDAELVGELLDRDRLLGEPARLEDTPLSVVERGECSPSAFLRLSDSTLSAGRASWLESQSCHSPSSRIGALSNTSPPSRRFMVHVNTSVWVTPSCRAIIFTWSGRMSPSSTEILLLKLPEIAPHEFQPLPLRHRRTCGQLNDFVRGFNAVIHGYPDYRMAFLNHHSSLFGSFSRRV